MVSHKRVRVHLAETLVAVDGDPLLAGGDEELDQVVERFDLELLVFRLRASRRLRFGREPGGVVDGPAADGRVGGGRLPGLICRGIVGRVVHTGAGRLDDHRALDALDVVVAVGQRAELGGQHEVEIDAVVLRIAAGAILDDDAERLVLFVGLHAGRAFCRC